MNIYIVNLSLNLLGYAHFPPPNPPLPPPYAEPFNHVVMAAGTIGGSAY